MTKSEIQKAAKVKYVNQSEKDFFLGCINRLGFFDISDSRLCSWFIKFVDISNENIIEYITDYEHLDLYYEKLSGSRIGKCEYCGKLFKQNKNGTAKFCYKHRGKIRKQISSCKICSECGNKFEISAHTQRDICDSCYKIYRNKKKNESKKVKKE